jgi:copper ion binding protein
MRSLFFILCTLFSNGVAAQTDTLTVRIKGMRCDECAHKVMTVVRQLPGIESLRSNTERRTTTIVYDRSLTCADSIEARLAATGRYKASPYSPGDTIRRGMGLRIDDMHCQGCASRIVKRLEQIEGIDSLSPHLDKHYVFIRYDANRTCKDIIRQAIGELGYTPVNYYSGPKIAFAYYNIPKEQATQETVDKLLVYSDAIDDANVNSGKGSLAVTYFKDELSADQLFEACRQLGISAEEPAPHECKEMNN